MNCFYCDVEIHPGKKNKRKDYLLATKDHLIPRSRAKGQLRDEGTVPCCVECQNQKAFLTIEEYRVLLAFRYGYIQGVDFKFPGEIQVVEAA